MDLGKIVKNGALVGVGVLGCYALLNWPTVSASPLYHGVTGFVGGVAHGVGSGISWVVNTIGDVYQPMGTNLASIVNSHAGNTVVADLLTPISSPVASYMGPVLGYLGAGLGLAQGFSEGYSHRNVTKARYGFLASSVGLPVVTFAYGFFTMTSLAMVWAATLAVVPYALGAGTLYLGSRYAGKILGKVARGVANKFRRPHPVPTAQA
ncbi:hypothetical protein COY95_03080, partial [Candidatus Woesearchaeota archaeon CG_4_10_14_0_8_um_filter_47_5]